MKTLSNKLFLLIVFLMSCGPPNDLTDNIQINDKMIDFEIQLLSTSGEIENTFEFRSDISGKLIFTSIPDRNIELKKLKYDQNGFFDLKIDELEIYKICYSPTVDVVNNKDKDIISVMYNHDHNSVKIYGDSVKDIQISISENIIDRDSYWLRNDKSFPENC